LFDVGRDPLMLIALPAPCRITPCSPPVSTAPLPRNRSWRKLRPLSGNSVTCFSVITWPMPAVSLSSATARPRTSTVSVSDPSSIARSTRST
jgi:hypothetical protein